MQITAHVHGFKLPFTINLGPGKALERFVYAYMIYGERIWLIDTGVAGSADEFIGYIKGTDRSPEELDTILLTHAHPDHIGAASELKRLTGCRVAAHSDSIPWIEDVGRQYMERPIPGFQELVGGSVEVNTRLADGDTVPLGVAGSLQVIHTPGHAGGHVCLHYDEDGVLFSGDCVPLAGSLPVYDDAVTCAKSIDKIRGLQQLRVLLSSWDEPRRGGDIPTVMNAGLAYLQRVHELVLEAAREHPEAEPTQIARVVVERLGLPAAALNPLVLNSIASHLRVADCPDLLNA